MNDNPSENNEVDCLVEYFVNVSDGMLDSLDAGLPPRSPEEAAAREWRERLLALLGNLEVVEPPPGWEDRVTARWRAAKRARRVRAWPPWS